MRYAASPTLSLVLLSAALLAQETPRDPGKKEAPRGDVEIRLYLIHKERKPVDFKDKSAAITVRPEKRGAKTYAMTLVQPREGDAVDGPFQTRELGPGFFAELRVAPAPSVEEEKKARPPAPPEPDPRRNGAEPTPPRERRPSLEEWRREHVLRGPYFRAVLRGDDVPRAFEASVTVRMGETSFTSRDFRYPFAEPEPPETVLGRLEASARKIAEFMEKIEFGKISAVTVKMEEDLAKLAGLDSRDPEVDLEYQRQWLLELTRKIDKASYTGNDDINALLKQVEYKVRVVRAALKGEPLPASEKKPEAEKKPQDK